MLVRQRLVVIVYRMDLLAIRSIPLLHCNVVWMVPVESSELIYPNSSISHRHRMAKIFDLYDKPHIRRPRWIEDGWGWRGIRGWRRGSWKGLGEFLTSLTFAVRSQWLNEVAVRQSSSSSSPNNYHVFVIPHLMDAPVIDVDVDDVDDGDDDDRCPCRRRLGILSLLPLS